MADIRTATGWLTKRALAQGYVEQKSWVDEKATIHAVELTFDKDTQEYVVQAIVGNAWVQISRFQPNELGLARKQFSKEARH